MVHAMMPTRERRPHTQQRLGDYLTSWIDSRAWLRPSTRATYRLHIERHINPALGHHRLDDLKPVDVERFAFALLARGLTGATVERILATLSSAYTTAVTGGLLDRNPVAAVRSPRQQARALPKWSATHAARFLDALGNDTLDVLFRTALITGMRRGELLGLRWSDLNLDEGEIHIRRGRIQVGARVLEGDLKTRHSVRTVYVDDYTRARLQGLAAKAQDTGGHVFTDVAGRPFTPGWVSYRFARRVQMLGLPGIRFHDLRHASATLGLATEESLKEVSQRLGHADITVTANIYTDVLPETARASARRLAQRLQEPNSAHVLQRCA